MKEPDLKGIEKRLAAVLEKERREAIGYTVLTVLCTPVFVVVAIVMVFLVLAYVLTWVDYDLRASSIYTGINIFLACMIVFVLRSSNPPEEPHELDKVWLASVGVFFILLILTYASGIRENFPVFFGIAYAILGFLILGLLGQVQTNRPATENTSYHNVFLSFVLAVCSFILMAYGEITHRSWLWIAPKPDELKVGAMILCNLALEGTRTLDSQAMQGRIVRILARLKFIKITENKIELTQKGLDFVEMGINY